MTLWSLLKYLVGNREAILQFAASRNTLWIGGLLVLAAGFAREYDGEDLVREPWHVLIPLGASIASSAVLWMLVALVAWLRGAKEPKFVSGYLNFLGLYWLTAPLALVYAIPVERLLSPADATAANLWMLAIVALWRVVLISRALSVLYRANFAEAFVVVMLFSDSLTLFILSVTPFPILQFMGGVRLSESENILLGTRLLVTFLGFVTFPMWLAGAIYTAWPKAYRWEYQAVSVAPSKVQPSVWTAAGLSLSIWLAILPFTQPEQWLRRQVERDLRAGRIRHALATMSAHEREDFPPHWDPPPRLAYRETRPDLAEVQSHLFESDVKPWVREFFLKKTASILRYENAWFVWSRMPAEEIERQVGLIERLPDRNELIVSQQDGLKDLLLRVGLSSELKDRVRRLLEGAGIPVTEETADVPAEIAAERPAVAEPQVQAP